MAKIRVTMTASEDGEQTRGQMNFLCPACMVHHRLDIPAYSFTGTTDKPTIGLYLINDKRDKVACAGSIEDGKITFSQLSPHYLAGQKVNMIEL